MRENTLYLNYQLPGNQLLLVHAFNPHAKVSQRMLARTSTGVTQEDTRRQAINLLENPRDIKQRVSLSMSLINQYGKNATWGHAGYIISIPYEDVISTSTSDNGSQNSNSRILKEMQKTNRELKQILPPDELYRRSSESRYNEVLAFSENAKIVGCFVKIGLDGKPLDEELARKVRQVAKDLSVECIEIKISNKEADKAADTFRTPKVYSFTNILFVGLVEGEGLEAIKYEIEISKEGLVKNSENIINHKRVFGGYKSSDFNKTPIEKTIEILTRAKEDPSNTPEQTSVIEKAIINCLKQKEIPSTTTTLREGNAKVGCFSSIINSFRSCLR